MRLAAHIGVCRNRKHDPEPGNEVMWRGCTRLSNAEMGHRTGRGQGSNKGCQDDFRDGKLHDLQQSGNPVVISKLS